MQTKLLFGLAIFLCLLSGCGGPCSNVTCYNGGYCIDGDCDCQPGYGGDDCSDLLNPTGFRVNQIILRSFPLRDINGNYFDPGGYPDPFVSLSKDGTFTGFSTGYKTDANPGTTCTYDNPGFPILLNSMTSRYDFNMYDYDFGNSSNDFMGGYFLILTQFYNRGSTKITMFNSNSWHRIEMDLVGEWIY
ncbi:MAG: hypothetical protein AAFY71_24680 [Bacteroidota bacterium]